MRTVAPSPDEVAMREAEAYLRAQDPVDVAAVAWHGRREQGLTAAEEAELRQWLAADPAHGTAFAHLDLSLRMLRRLPAESTAHLRSACPASASAVAVVAPRAGSGRWHRLGERLGERLSAALSARTVALCCTALLSAGAGWQWWIRQPTFEHTYTAQRGQRLDISLPDGSQLTLDTETRLEVALYRDRRVTRLPGGQAMFIVARDPSRPFTVLAGPATVTVLGTRFSVRRKGSDLGDAETDVEVEEGHVSVAQTGVDGAADGSGRRLAAAELRAGQAIQVSVAGGLGSIAAVNPRSIAPWRKGLLRFTSTPLGEAVREFERYAPVNLVISDPEVAAMPVGGSYRSDNPAAFAQALPHILPVRLVRRDDGMTEVAKKN